MAHLLDEAIPELGIHLGNSAMVPVGLKSSPKELLPVLIGQLHIQMIAFPLLMTVLRALALVEI